MGISDKIESFIAELLKTADEDEWVELRRNELASVFNCVPSQINYVIATRFNTDSGYAVESRRGGGGYLKIRRINTQNPILSEIKAVPESLDFTAAKNHIKSLTDRGAIDNATARVLTAAVSDNSITIPQPERDKIRANILKNALASLV